jgi:hypothetical protein
MHCFSQRHVPAFRTEDAIRAERRVWVLQGGVLGRGMLFFLYCSDLYAPSSLRNSPAVSSRFIKGLGIACLVVAPHGKSRTSRSLQSCASLNFRPHPEQISLRFPCLRRTHKRRVLAFSSISCRKTRYPGHPKIFVNSLSRILPSPAEPPPPRKHALLLCLDKFLLRAF